MTVTWPSLNRQAAGERILWQRSVDEGAQRWHRHIMHPAHYRCRVEYLRPSTDACRAVGQLRDWLDAAQPPALLIETSGSTGRPKRVLLSRAAVVASARASAARLREEGREPGRWSLRLPSSYVAGVQVIVRSLLAGHEPLIDDWSDEQGRAAYVSLVPTQLHRMLNDPAETEHLAALDAVLLGGGPIEARLRARAEDAGIFVVATYGASETAGGCVYDGHPLDGVAVALDAESRIRLGGPTIFSGYEGDPTLSAQCLVNGWFVTNDAGMIDHDGRLRVLGRIDDVAISGGVKVSLPAVARRLREHPQIEQVEVVGVADHEWGHRVVAVLTTHARGGLPSLSELRDWVGDVHDRAWAPRQLVKLEEMPLLANGKVDRQAVQHLAEQESPA